MMTGAIDTAFAYHKATTHERGGIAPHYLDFGNFPAPFKQYDFLETTDLAPDTLDIKADTVALFNGQTAGPGPATQKAFDLKALCRVLFLGSGVTGRGPRGGAPLFLRSVPSAGALHPCHIYLAVQCLPGIETGLYYCNMVQEFLGLIQKGKDTPLSEHGFSLSLIITGEFFKSSWKYRERAFRYILLDAGHLAENLLLAFKASGMPSRIVYDFDDERASRFLQLVPDIEVPLLCLNAGGHVNTEPGDREMLPPLYGPRAREKEKTAIPFAYPLLNTVYELTKTGGSGKPDLETGSETVRTGSPAGEHREKCVRIAAEEPPVRINYGRTVLNRRSRRNFAPAFFETQKAASLLNLVFTLFRKPGALSGAAHRFLVPGVSCMNVQGVEDGVYHLAPDGSSLVLAKAGVFQALLSRVCLDQKWIADACLNFLFTADLKNMESVLGPRAYRSVLMDAGRAGQRIYLAAAGLGLGCCGVGALYDEEARALFDLDDNRALLYVVSAGPVKKHG